MVEEASVLEQLRNKSKCAFDLLYTSYYPSVERFIVTNNGSTEDAKDIFQEALIILTKNISRDDFQLTSSLKTYLYSISKNLWLKSLRNEKHISSIGSNENEYTELSDTSAQDKENEEQVVSYVDRLIAKIPVHCQKIVQYVFFQNIPVEKIAKKMGYSNNHTASNVKYKCLQQMKKASDKTELL